MGHDLAAAQSETAIGRVAFLVWCSEATKVRSHVFFGCKAFAVVGAAEAIAIDAEFDTGGAGVNGVHQQLDDCLADRAGLTVDDVVDDLRVKFKWKEHCYL